METRTHPNTAEAGPAAAPPRPSSPRRTIAVVGSGRTGASAPRHPPESFGMSSILPPKRSVHEVVREGTKRLRIAGTEHAHHEAEWLLSRLMGSTRFELYVEEREISESVADRFFSQIDARADGVPLQYLLGEAEFYGERFVVSPGVFIPRPETETIVGAMLDVLRARAQQLGRPLRLLELGIGSGCIAVTLAQHLPACLVIGVELSWTAMPVAQANIQRHGCSTSVRLVHGRWTQPVRGGFDGIISNPPYIPSSQVDHLPLDVRHEPRVSLDGGPDGMRELSHIMAQAPWMLRAGGVLALECGEEQAQVLADSARAATWVATATVLHDLANRPRGLLIRRH